MYVCMYVCVCMFIYIYIYTHIHTYIYICIYIYIYIYIHNTLYQVYAYARELHDTKRVSEATHAAALAAVGSEQDYTIPHKTILY